MAMSEETRRRLNRALWTDRLKKAGIGVAILAAIAAVIAYQNLDLAVDNKQVAGVIETIEPLVAPNTVTATQGPGVTVGVKLDDGRHVRVIAYKSRNPYVGEHIEIVEHHHHTGRVTHTLK